MLTTRHKLVDEIVGEMQRKRDFLKSQQDIIAQNWREIREQGFGLSARSRTPAILDYESGRMLYDILPDGAWKDQRCFIIGGGKSLKGFDFSKLQNELTIGINRAYEAMDCTIMLSMDNDFYDWITKGKLGQEAKEKFEDFKGIRVWIDSVGYEYPKGILILNRSGGQNISHSMKKGIGGESNSGFAALNIAYCLGANPIYLLGFDMKGENGKQAWWHSGYPDKQGAEVYKVFARDFKRASVILKEKGTQVINLNPDSALQCFEFGEFKDIQPITRPIIISYYTEGSEYQLASENLKGDLRRFNLENDIVGIPDQGNWHRNTYYKPRFIKEMTQKHPGRAIVFVDADARIRGNPSLFNNYDCDFGCHFRLGKELLSGTLYFGNTKEARLLLDTWIEEDIMCPRTHMPQKNLRSVFNRLKGKLKWKALPVEYCMIFDSQARHKVNPIIEHFQLSRKHKDPKGRLYRYQMTQDLREIQAFCKGKRICILGNADSVLRRKRNIDGFDIVGRMNRGAPAGLEQFIGSRTDILFLSTGMSGDNIRGDFDPRFVVWMTACHRLAQPWTLRNAIQNPKEDWHFLYKKLGINPTTGMMTLNFILNHIEYKSLTIYGFDFFKTKTWYNTRIDDGQKHSGKKEEGLFMEMIKGKKGVRFVK